MKLFANKKLFKKIVILLVIITLINALTPLHMVSADTDEDFGGALFRPICQFIAGIGDLLISGLQLMFIGDGDIKTGEIPELGESTYVIRYSPGVIFSNKVPGLDANFINPSEPLETKKLKGETTSKGQHSLEAIGKLNIGFDYDNMQAGISTTAGSGFLFFKVGTDKVNTIYRWNYEEKSYVLFKQNNADELSGLIGQSLLNNPTPVIPNIGTYLNGFMAFDWIKTNLNNDWTLYEIDNSVTDETVAVKESTAAQLQAVVSKWYKALRMVALVALLSVLVYVGIRIIISSTGQEKAKYKKMIGDWVAAICILFILNYIMAFTMDIIEKVTEVFSLSGLIDVEGADRLMTGVRNNINSNQFSSGITFTYLILYLVLVVYTVIFTIHYLKRVVYLAFFTMIAPLIAVTYPIDKIKDGQAQAFGTWIKEYTFNAAIPVIHIIIYYALVESAANLAEANPLYAIVCISFLIPAEKFFKKLFGFEKANTVGQLGAAAGGALIMNAINKMGHKSGKQAAAKAGASTPRTDGGSGYIAAPGEGGGALAGGGTASGGGTAPAGGKAPSGGGTPSATVFGQSINGGIPVVAKSGNIAGIKNVAGRYINKNTAKSAGRMLRKGLVGAAGAGLGATAGLVAGISTGDFSNVLKYGAAGLGAGFSGANYLGDKAVKGAGNVNDSFQEGKWGTDEFNTRKQIKELSSDSEFNKTCDSLGIKGKKKEEAIRAFNANGITDSNAIKKAMNVQAKTGASPSEIIAAQKIRQQADKDKLKTGEIRSSLASKGLSNADVDRAMNLINML